MRSESNTRYICRQTTKLKSERMGGFVCFHVQAVRLVAVLITDWPLEPVTDWLRYILTSGVQVSQKSEANYSELFFLLFGVNRLQNSEHYFFDNIHNDYLSERSILSSICRHITICYKSYAEIFLQTLISQVVDHLLLGVNGHDISLLY